MKSQEWERGPQAGEQIVPRQSCQHSCGAAERTAQEDVGLDPREPVCIYVEEENSFLWKPGPLALRPFPFSAQFSSRRELASFSTMQDLGYKPGGSGLGGGSEKSTRIFQAPLCFSRSHRPPRRRTMQRGLRDPDSCFDGGALGNGVSRPQA